MNHYSESDTRSKFIDPFLYDAGWSEDHIIREWAFTDGRKLPGNKRGKQCFADYVLKFQGVQLAIIEAKKYGLPPTEGLEQVKEYGKKLHIRRVYSSNGQKIYEFDLQEGIGSYRDQFPSPRELYERVIDPTATLRQHILSTPYCIEANKRPRYYQDIAVSQVLTAISQGQQRILLTLATGTGKTFIAFQIAYKLFMAKWSLQGINRRPRILFLADRNILITQALNTFNPLEKDLLWVTGKEIKKRHGIVPTNANIFFAIYQAIIAGSDEDSDAIELGNDEVSAGYYRNYDPHFFDLIIIDECHRGGANENGNRHAILQYFSSAVQLGMTATPKRNDNVDTYHYFGDPVYEYSLKEGINDGFLTPYKVKRIRTNMEELVINSEVEIITGEAKKDLYSISDFDRAVIVPERTDLVCQEILKQIGTFDKTIIFCVDQEHALRVRDSINAHKTIKDPDYCVRVTSNEGEIGRKFLERFQDNEKTIPTILTSSQMLTTGVDAKNVRNIVLLRTINSMTEFKQIIGRGTRVFEGKDYFTIIDFTGATNLFYDPLWDGEEEKEDKEKKDLNGKDDFRDTQDDGNEDIVIGEPPLPFQKLEVKLHDNRALQIVNIEIRYIDETGKPLSATQYLEQLIGKLPALYESEEQLRKLRADPETREKLLAMLDDIGIDKEQLETLQMMFQAQDSDIYDILAHLSFSSPLKSRDERVQRVKVHDHLQSLAEDLNARKFLEFVLGYYAQHGSVELVRSKIGSIIELYNKGNINDMMRSFGGGEQLMKAWKKLQEELFVI